MLDGCWDAAVNCHDLEDCKAPWAGWRGFADNHIEAHGGPQLVPGAGFGHTCSIAAQS